MTVRLHTLSNGARVLFDPMPALETFAVSVVVRGGARFEDEARSGWSHLLEHMVFKGAGDRSAQGIVEAIEGEGGQINAATGYERTSFQVRALKGRLPTAMEVLSDLLFRPAMAADELEREKDVVGQEIAEAFDTPDDHVFELAQSKAFEGQSLGRPILGSVESVGSADRDALDAWRRALYAPGRMAIAVAGAVDEAEVLEQAERWFGAQPAADGAGEPDPARFVGGSAGLARRIEQANLVWQLPAPGSKDDAYFALRLFAEILGGGMASRLFQEAREKRGLAYSIDAYADTFEDAGVLGVFAGASAGEAQALARLVAEQIAELADRPREDELARAKAQLKGSMFMAQESPLARAERAAAQTLMFGRPFTTAEIGTEIDEVEVDDLRAVGARLLEPEAAAGAVLGPKAALKAGETFGRALFG